MATTENVISAGGAAPSPFRRPPPVKPVSPAGPAFGNSPRLAPRPVTTPRVTAPASTATAASVPTAAPVQDQQLARRRRLSALWFFWVGGLTSVNTLLPFTGQHVRFVIGLGTTQLVTGLAARSGRGWAPAILLDLLLIGAFLLLGYFALRGQLWAFAIGTGIYALDGLIFLVARRWVGLAFHVFVLAMMVKGFLAARQLDAGRT